MMRPPSLSKERIQSFEDNDSGAHKSSEVKGQRHIFEGTTIAMEAGKIILIQGDLRLQTARAACCCSQQALSNQQRRASPTF